MPPRRGTRDRRGRALPRHRARSASRTSLASGRRFAVRRRAWPLIVFGRQVDRTARAPYRAVLTATDPGGRSTAKPVLVAFTIVVDRKARPSAVSDSGPWRQLGSELSRRSGGPSRAAYHTGDALRLHRRRARLGRSSTTSI